MAPNSSFSVPVAGAEGAGASTSSGSQSKSREIIIEDVVVPTFEDAESVPEVQFKPDLKATEFSCQNAFFFAKMSKIAYATRDEVHDFMLGGEAKKGLGFDHFYWFEADNAVSGRSIFDAIQDTEAFVAANDESIMVVFRGTQEITDWATNLNFFTRRVPEDWGLVGEGCDVHEGFDDGLNTVWEGEKGMHATVKKLYEEEGKSRKLFIAGHSLGAALASVASARLAFVDNMHIAAVYTIGSPRVFDGQLAAHYDARLNHGTLMKDKNFRCRNNNDIVPCMVPPPYCHIGTEIYLDRFGALGTTNWVDRILGQLSAYLRFSFIDGVNDHSASEYIRHFKQLVVNSNVSFFDKAKSIVKDAAKKVVPHHEKSKLQEAKIEVAKKAALDASKEAFHPSTHLPEYDTEKEVNTVKK